MRRTHGTSDEEPVTAVTSAEELGWDDSLYDDGARAGTASSTGSGDGATAPGGDGAGEQDPDSPDPAAAESASPLSGRAARKQARRQAKAAGRQGRQAADGEAADDAAAPEAAAMGADDGGGDGNGGGNGGGASETPGKGRPGRSRRPRWVRVLATIGTCLAVLIAGAGIAGYFYIEHLNSNLTKADLHLGDNKLEKPPPNAEGQSPLNILMIGSDARDSEANLELGGARDTADGPPIADVQMLLHVSADRTNMTVISIPRDTRVSIPKCTDPETGESYDAVESDTINHSLQRGGPGCTVATWEELTGIPIDHFMMLDFAGVVSMADAVGGVPVCVDANIDDHRSGLRLEEGESVVRGEEALQWLRTRHGFEDGSDVGRTKAQHMYLSAMVRELQAGTKLTEPAQLNSLANAATKALTVDGGLGSVNRLYDLGEELRDVPTERINMITMPWEPAPQNPEAHIIPKPGAAAELFSLVREDIALDEEPLEDEELVELDEAAEREEDAEEESEEEPAVEAQAPADIPLAVRNGTGSVSLAPVSGRAGDLANQLYTYGFTQTWTDDRPSSQGETTLFHPDNEQARANALSVAETLDLPERAIRASVQFDGLMLVVGADWREGVSYPAPAESGTGDEDGASDGPQERLDSSDALSADESACMTVNPRYTW